MKIVVLDGHTLNPGDLSWEGLDRFGEVTVYERTPPDQIVGRAAGAAVLLTNKTPLTDETLSRLPDLKYIGVLATGYNVVDIAAARQRGIPVTNIPTYGTKSVAQLVFALLLELCHHVGAHHEAVRRGDWTAGADFCFWNFPLIELAGKTMGLIGFGRIGRQVAEIAAAFAMNVVAYDKFQSDESGRKNFKWVELDELLAMSDVVSLHCPLFPETQGIINRDSLGQMKRSAFLINTSRGPLVVDQDLARALDEGRIAGAGLDVLSEEPPRSGNPLLHAQNCIITPHIAWATKEARGRLMDTAVRNVADFLTGNPVNVVN